MPQTVPHLCFAQADAPDHFHLPYLFHLGARLDSAPFVEIPISPAETDAGSGSILCRPLTSPTSPRAPSSQVEY